MAKPKRPRDPNQLAKLILDMATGDAPRDSIPRVSARANGGKIGGKRRAEKLTPEQRREIARKAAKARWG